MADYTANPGVPFEGNQPGSQKPKEDFSTSEFLPQYINTKINKKFLRGTLDLMTSTASFETLHHYVGKQKFTNNLVPYDKVLIFNKRASI